MNDPKQKKPLATLSNRKVSMQIYRLPAVLGRNSNEVDAYIFHESISRKHCVLESVEGKFVLQDIGSTYGTEINGTRLEPGRRYYVYDGDKVRLGNLKLTFNANEDDLIQYEKMMQSGMPGMQSPAGSGGEKAQNRRIAVKARELSPYEYDEREVITIDCGLRTESGKKSYTQDLYSKDRSDSGSSNDPFRTQQIAYDKAQAQAVYAKSDADYNYDCDQYQEEEDIESTVILDQVNQDYLDDVELPVYKNMHKRKHLILKWREAESGESRSVEIRRFPYRIGRKASENDLVFSVSGISRRHLTVTENRGEFFITDENSTNGVRLNGSRIEPLKDTAVSEGDIIRIARLELIVQITED